MADNLTTQSATPATIPASTVLATDDVSGVHYPVGKVAHGAADSATLVSLSSGLPVQPGTSTTWTPASTESHLGEVGGNTPQILTSFTRPADTTAYAVNDSVNSSTSAPAVLTFTNAARISGGSGYVTKAKLMTDQAACTARLRLHLYNASSLTLSNDNAAFTLIWADRVAYLGYVDFPALAQEGTGSTAAKALTADVRMGFKCGADRHLYGLLQTLDAFTPASAQNFHVELMTENN